MKPAAERLASYKPRLERAKQWVKFYSTEGDAANKAHWQEVQASLEARIMEAEQEIGATTK